MSLVGCSEETLSPSTLATVQAASAATATAAGRLGVVRIVTPTPALLVPTRAQQIVATLTPRPTTVPPTPIPPGPVVTDREYLATWNAIRQELNESMARFSNSWPGRFASDIEHRQGEVIRQREYRLWQTLPNRLRQISPPPALARIGQLHTETLTQLALAGRGFAIAYDPESDPLVAQVSEHNAGTAMRRFEELIREIDATPLPTATPTATPTPRPTATSLPTIAPTPTAAPPTLPSPSPSAPPSPAPPAPTAPPPPVITPTLPPVPPPSPTAPSAPPSPTGGASTPPPTPSLAPPRPPSPSPAASAVPPAR